MSNVIAVNVNSTYRDARKHNNGSVSRQDLYECTRWGWIINQQKVHSITHVLAVWKNDSGVWEVKGVFKPTEWYNGDPESPLPKYRKKPEPNPKRCCFKCKDISSSNEDEEIAKKWTSDMAFTQWRPVRYL
ncbi:MAG: hypothetical protein FWE23_10720 [Chitinivibrionia bacterium]|nr:hypothetical protein [Chitinivibrionia bacterium]